MLGQPDGLQQDLRGELIGGRDALLELDADHDLFLTWFAEPDDAAQEYRAVAEDRLLDQVRVDGAACGSDPVPGPVGVVEEAVLVEVADVVRAEPVAGEERLCVALRQAPVLA
jgi:hypothetical protein